MIGGDDLPPSAMPSFMTVSPSVQEQSEHAGAEPRSVPVGPPLDPSGPVKEDDTDPVGKHDVSVHAGGVFSEPGDHV